jgi:hypothetical protein
MLDKLIQHKIPALSVYNTHRQRQCYAASWCDWTQGTQQKQLSLLARHACAVKLLQGQWELHVINILDKVL